MVNKDVEYITKIFNNKIPKTIKNICSENYFQLGNEEFTKTEENTDYYAEDSPLLHKIWDQSSEHFEVWGELEEFKYKLKSEEKKQFSEKEYFVYLYCYNKTKNIFFLPNVIISQISANIFTDLENKLKVLVDYMEENPQGERILRIQKFSEETENYDPDSREEFPKIQKDKSIRPHDTNSLLPKLRIVARKYIKTDLEKTKSILEYYLRIISTTQDFAVDGRTITETELNLFKEYEKLSGDKLI